MQLGVGPNQAYHIRQGLALAHMSSVLRIQAQSFHYLPRPKGGRIRLESLMRIANTDNTAFGRIRPGLALFLRLVEHFCAGRRRSRCIVGLRPAHDLHTSIGSLPRRIDAFMRTVNSIRAPRTSDGRINKARGDRKASRRSCIRSKRTAELVQRTTQPLRKCAFRSSGVRMSPQFPCDATARAL